MHFGIAFPSYVEAWRDCELAEASGFTHGWFYDTQLLCSDVYATMALAAEHTRTMRLGTLVAIPSNRIAPVTASAIATINALAPGRVILGVGTGFTGRATMGMPPVPVAAMARYVEQVRGLLAGEDVLIKDGKYERWIRLLTTDRKFGCINIDDPIPIHMAANAPKALTAVGQSGDGWISVGLPAEAIGGLQQMIQTAASAAGRTLEGPDGRPYTTMLTTGCILADGEGLDSARVLGRVGPVVVVATHAAWEAWRGQVSLGFENEDLARAFDGYIEAYAARRGSAADRRYLDVHEGHMIYLKEGEDAFVTPELIPALSITGSPEQVLERVRGLRDAGVDNLALQAIPGMARDLIEEFSHHVIAKL